MKAVILAAGFVTPDKLSRDRPRSLILVKNKPIIEHIIEKIEQLKKIEKIYIITNNKFKPLFDAWIIDSQSEKIEVISNGIALEIDLLGPVRDLNYLISLKKIKDDLLIIAGDNLFDFNLKNFIEDIETRVGIYDTRNPDMAKNYGVVKVEQGKLVDLEEKPEKTDQTLVSTAIYLIPKKKISLIKKFLKTEKETLGEFVKFLITKEEVSAYEFHGSWYDIADYETLELARKEY